MNEEKIRIILVDDHELVRKSWKMLLENNPRFLVIGECGNGEDAIKIGQRLIPDVMLVDINMSPVNGFMVTEKLSETNPSIKIIGLSINNQPNYANRMLSLGAKGYITKTTTLEEVNNGIVRVFNGEKYICEEVRKNML